MLNETNNFGRLVWTISSKMTSFFANETTDMFLFFELRWIFLSEVFVRVFAFSGRSVRMLLEMTFLFGWTSAFFIIFALDFEVWFLQAEVKGCLFSHNLSRHNIVNLMRTIKGIPLKLQVILCTFMEAQLQEQEPKRCKLL